MNEEWKDIPGFEGAYQASNLGKIRSLDREIEYANRWGTSTKFKICGKELKQNDNGNGYLQVSLGAHSKRNVHSLIAQTFLNKPDDKEVNRKDLNKRNNNVNNLECVTRSQNQRHMVRNGRLNTAKLTPAAVAEIKVLLNEGRPHREIANKLGVSKSTISSINSGKTWTWL
jgi:hypothetical protein